jgi:hypothetical protein
MLKQTPLHKLCTHRRVEDPLDDFVGHLGGQALARDTTAY